MIKLPDFIIKIIDKFDKNGFQIFVVGGAVRDILLGRKVENWDMTTNANPTEIQKLFPDSFYNNDYGTVTIKISKIKDQKSNILVEVTPFRKESDYQDNRHPGKIEWAKTIEEDLARRDFSINAMAFDGNKIIDIYDGQKHLAEKLIVCVGDPDIRFQEDGLRLMRAIRLAAQLRFLIEEKTKLSIQKNSSLISNISWERIRDELLKILASNHPTEGILFMKQTGLLGYVLPEVDVCFLIPQKSPKRHHIYDVGTHLVMALKNCPSHDPIVRLAALLHDIGKAKTFRKDEKTGLITFYNHEVVGTKLVTKISDRLRLSNIQSDKLIQLVKYHQFSVSEMQTDKAVRRFIRELGKDYIQDMLDIRTADRIGSGSTPTSWRLELFKKRIIEVQKQPFTVADLKIDGHDVMKILGIKPGKKVGKVLNKLFEMVVEKKIKNEKEVLIEQIKKLK